MVFSEDEEDDDPVQRRTFVGLTGASLFGAVLPGAVPSQVEGLERLAALLTRYEPIEGQGNEVRDLKSLARGVSEAKQAFQACRYSRLVEDLPELLATVQRTSEETSGDDRLASYGLSAHAHHIAASVLLKYEDKGMAWLAAVYALWALCCGSASTPGHFDTPRTSLHMLADPAGATQTLPHSQSTRA